MLAQVILRCCCGAISRVCATWRRMGCFSENLSSPAIPPWNCHWASGDWALLYTDGISETMDPSGVEFGAERFREFLAEDEALRRSISPTLLEEVSRWSARGPGEELDDDITLVAIHSTRQLRHRQGPRAPYHGFVQVGLYKLHL